MHNAYACGATEFKIIITELVIELIDNGTGMSRDTIINHFWNLGDSKSRGNQYAIGEKGHVQKYTYGQIKY